jgi:hypothetical protein
MKKILSLQKLSVDKNNRMDGGSNVSLLLCSNSGASHLLCL